MYIFILFFSRKILKFCGGLTKVHVDTQNARSYFTKDLITNKYLAKKPRNIVCLNANVLSEKWFSKKKGQFSFYVLK